MLKNNGLIFYNQNHVNNDYLIKKYDLNFEVEKIHYPLTYDYYIFILPNFIQEIVDSDATGHPCGYQICNSKHFKVKERKKIKVSSDLHDYHLVHIIKGEPNIFLPKQKPKNIFSKVVSKIGFTDISNYEKIQLEEGDVLLLPNSNIAPINNFYIENDSMILQHDIKFMCKEGYGGK